MKRINKRVVERTHVEQAQDNNTPHPFFQTPPTQQINHPITQPHQPSNHQSQKQQIHFQPKSQQKNEGGDEARKIPKQQGKEVRKNIDDQISVSPNSHLKASNSTIEVSATTSAVGSKAENKSQEDRKSKIEQLKLKYLKKNNNEAKSQIVQAAQSKREVTTQAISLNVQQSQMRTAQIIPKQNTNPSNKTTQIVQSKHQQAIQKVNNLPFPESKPKLEEIVKQKQEKTTSKGQNTKDEVTKQDQAPSIKQNSKTNIPPPPQRNKNAPKHPFPKQMQQKVSKDSIPSNEAVKPQPFFQPKPVESAPQQLIKRQSASKIDKSQQVHLSIEQQVRLWLQNPSSLLLPYFSYIDKLTNVPTEPSFTFSSKNPHFSSALNDFILQFALKNKNALSEGQKAALHNIAVQYFLFNHQPSIQLVMILTKLGNPYFGKHAGHIFKNLQSVCFTVASNKLFFSNEELSDLVNCFTQSKDLSQKDLLSLLLIHPSQKLLNVLANRNFNNIRHILTFLSLINLKKDWANLIILYLKLINILVDNMPQNATLIQKILKHLNELQNNQKSYQLHKQIKLKLINLISKAQSQPKAAKSQVKEQKEKGDGLVGYWNQALDKIKTATTQLVDLKEPPKTAPKQEEKQEDIVYDPVLKRYLINGKVPQDETEKPKDNTTPKAPPPKQNNRPAPPPLPGKNQKWQRIVTLD